MFVLPILVNKRRKEEHTSTHKQWADRTVRATKPVSEMADKEL